MSRCALYGKLLFQKGRKVMDYEKELGRRDKCIADCKKVIKELKGEIEAFNQLLDCASANLVVMVKEKGGSLCLSKNEVREALGKYSLKAKDDGEGNYILELIKR